jgi:hypothetical protein
MVAQIRQLPLSGSEAFTADPRNVLAAESCLRRALEALFDVARHILARAFGVGVSEYREIADGLEVSTDELYQVCAGQLDDLTTLTAALRGWFDSHQELVDSTL